MNTMSTDNVLNLSSGVNTDMAPRQVIFIENSLNNWQQLASLLPASAEVVVLDAREDGMAQMASYLASKPAGSVDSLQLLSHGDTGAIQLGAATLTLDTLAAHAESLRQIGQALSAKADWQIYGCDVASGTQGQQFIQTLSQLSGIENISASTNRTGAGGDWVLEEHTGVASVTPDWVASAETGYSGALAITHTFDSGMTNTGSNTATITVKNTTTNVSIKMVAANGVWRIGNDVANGYTTTYSGNWAINEAGVSSLVAITVDLNNDGTFGDPFSLNSFKLSDPSFNGGTYTIKPNGLSAGQETILLSSMVDTYSTFTPTTVTNFNNITGFTVQFDSSSTGITLDDFDVGPSAVVNTPPSITSGATASLTENASTSTVVYTATATDAESNAISYSLSGTDASSFTINSSTGVVRKLTSANYEVKNSYSITVVASDGTASSTKAVTVSINDVNETPVFSSGTTGSVAENAPTSTVVYTGAATDPESGAVTYSLSGTDAASFSINSSTGALTLNTSANYEAKTSYSLNVLASDGVNTALQSVTISVTNVNEKPVITAPASQSVNQGVATALTGISVADPDSGANPITVSLSAPAGTFTSTTGSGVTVAGSGTSSMTLTGTQTSINNFITASKVTYTTAAGATGTVTLSIGSNDGGNSGSGGTQTDSATETLNIAVANAAPTITSGASGSVAENAATSTVVYTTTATDPESDALTYVLTGTDAASFTIDTAGAVRLVSPADFETKSSYSIIVNAKDASNTTTKAVTINVTDVNEAPNITSGATGSVAENAATSTVVYTAAASDPEGGAVSYSLAGTDAASFSINSSTGAVTLNASADYETKSSYNLTLIAADASSNTSGQAVTISVTNVNEKPVLTAPASQNVMQATATALTGISVADPDSGSNPITVSLSAPAGTFTSTTGSGVTVLGSGTSSMTLTGTQSNINSFITASKVTYTTAAGATGTVTLSIGSNDGGNSGSGGTQTDSKTETLNVVPPNAAPVITSGASGSVAENAATSTVVYTATATDAESDTIAYALSGTDAASFSINSSTGAVTLNASADFETKSSYSITVNAKDASNTTTKAVTINVTDVNEAPTNIALSASSVAENTSTTSALNIGNLTSTDPDTGNTFTYSVVGGADQASFQVTGAALQFKAGTTLDYETKNSYAVTVRSTDQGGLTFDKAFTVTLTDANDKPVITVPASQNITIGAAAALSGISVADQDAGSNSISLALSVPAGTLTATSGGGVTVSGSGSGSLTLAGSQSAINTFLSGGGVSYATAAGASAGSTVTLSLVANDNGFSGGGAQTGNGSVTLNLAAAGGGGGGGGGGASGAVVDGVSVSTSTVTRSDGSIVSTKIIPVIPSGRVDQDGASPNADIPLAGSNTTPAIKAEIPTGIGMTSIGGDSTKTDKTDLITAIKSRTVDKSADQNSMVDLGNFFLKTLPNSVDLWVRTVVISADSSKDAAGSLVFRGQTSDSNTDTALVLDFSNLPKNSKVSTENINFAAVVGEVNITTGDGNQLLIADNKAQTLDLGAGNDTVYSGAGDDVLNNSKGNDKLFGQGGNDTFNAENGQNTLHGGTDSDTAKFTGKRADYTVERHDGYVKVINNADTSKSTLVVNTETLQFADSSETIQARDELKVLAGSYLQVLGRQADVYGFDYFGDLQSKGYSLGGIAINMIKSDEAKARGFVLTGDAVNDVEMLYKAILGRESDAGGKAAWVQQMQSGGMTLEQVANAFMVSGEMQKHYLVQTGWDFLV